MTELLSLNEAVDLLWPKCVSRRKAEQLILEALRLGKIKAKADRVGCDWKTGEKELIAEDAHLKAEFWMRPWPNWNMGLVVRRGPPNDEYDPLNPKRAISRYVAFGINLYRSEILALMSADSKLDDDFESKSNSIASKQRGGYTVADRGLFDEIEQLLNSGKARGAFGAAKILGDRMAGPGTLENRAKRVSTLFNKERGRGQC